MKVDYWLLKLVRWTGWPLFPVAVAFLCTGYIMSGRYGFGQLLDEKTALSIHKMLHLPLIFLLLVHSLAAMYLALERWGWLRFPRPAASRQPPGQKG